MSNGARHGLGALIGVVLTPVIAACLLYGAGELQRVARYSLGSFRSYHGSDLWIGTGLMLVTAILVGLVVGTRVSPVASLIPGAVFAGIGVLWVVDPLWMLRNTSRDLPDTLAHGYMMFGPYGLFLLLGGVLLVASVAPSRWKSRTAAGAAPRFGGPPPAPMGQPPMHGAQAPMGAHHAPQASPAPGQNPPWQGGAPQYGQPPAQLGASNPPPLPAAPPASPAPPPAGDKPRSSSQSDPDDDNPGEWTQMYGGNRPT
ncbi:hypothetical protein [Spirillospora sp. NPDC048819]|uniref:hypothetical protein n=1 Tax=Spirillospora sp. NPDC048819 TaxID=3155268 RepID=UPI0033F7AADE